jgi:hypothetical protein
LPPLLCFFWNKLQRISPAFVRSLASIGICQEIRKKKIRKRKNPENKNLEKNKSGKVKSGKEEIWKRKIRKRNKSPGKIFFFLFLLTEVKGTAGS